MTIDRAKLHTVYRFLIDWFYPNVCPCCGGTIDFDADFCAGCKSRITPYSGSGKLRFTDGFTAFCCYDRNIDDPILRFKKDPNGNFSYAFARGISEAVLSAGFADCMDLIVPIPITSAKRKSRGYNQTELIARELRSFVNVPYKNVLLKTRDTGEQKNLYGRDRFMNVRNVFALNPDAPEIAGKRVLLIDDVCTTGATLSEAAKTLRAGGAEKVYAAAFAWTPLDRKES